MWAQTQVGVVWYARLGILVLHTVVSARIVQKPALMVAACFGFLSNQPQAAIEAGFRPILWSLLATMVLPHDTAC